jgi:hypothetical protein
VADRPGHLREQVEQMLRCNRVEEMRRWNGPSRRLAYHAPSLGTEPTGWLSFLAWPWRQLVRPWQVHYPHQWFWDSCAHAIVLSHLNLELAKAEIEALLYAQRDDGFIAHMIWNKAKMHWLDRLASWVYPSRYTSPYLQPPLLATAVESIYIKEGDRRFVSTLLPAVKKYYHYLDRVRNRSHDGLLEIIISYESGKDRSPEYDEIYGTTRFWPLPIMRLVNRQRRLGWDLELILANNGFRVKDLLFNCVYAQNLMALNRICLGAGDDEAELFRSRAQATEAAILSKMYHAESGLFFSLDTRSGHERQIRVTTVSALLPLMLDSISQPQVDRLVRGYLTNPSEFWDNYPVPAEPLSAPPRKKLHIWRGQQTWVYTNWLIVRGLHKQARRFPQQRQDYNSIAAIIIDKTCQLVEQWGFREYYNSRTGQGCRARNFGWSALVLDMVYNK